MLEKSAHFFDTFLHIIHMKEHWINFLSPIREKITAYLIHSLLIKHSWIFFLHFFSEVKSINRNMKLIKVETVIIHVSSILEVTAEFEINFDLSLKARMLLQK